MLNSIFKSIKQAIYATFLRIPKRTILQVKIHIKKLQVQDLLIDFFAVATKIGFVIVPAFLVGFLFLISQGKDVLRIVVEKILEDNYWQLIFLMFGIFLWSFTAELGVRYAIAISDNSGKKLSQERIDWRRTVQKLLAGFFLFFPALIVVFGLFLSLLDNNPAFWSKDTYAYFVCLLCVTAIAVFIGSLYHPLKKRSFSNYLIWKLFGDKVIGNHERKWLDKLFGIYDDYIYSFPKEDNFIGDYFNRITAFTEPFSSDQEKLKKFMQDPEALSHSGIIPAEFYLVDYSKIKSKKERGEYYRWVYKIPTPFFHGLHHQVVIAALVSLVLFISISILDVDWGVYTFIGAPALVCIAFGCLTGLYTGLLYIDRALLRDKIYASVRFWLIFFLFFFSFINDDHPARFITESSAINTPADSGRTKVSAHFKAWFKEYKHKVDPYSDALTDTNLVHPEFNCGKYPVFFICAEGGAFRTGAYTGLYLTQLEEKLAKSANIDVRHSIFAMSGVSGGAVGLGVYDALAYRSNVSFSDAIERAKLFFSYDAISPIIGKMFFGEFINLFWPRNIDLFNRASALEKAFELAFVKDQKNKNVNVLKEPFLPARPTPAEPLLVLNSTEVETGLQCWVSNYEPDTLGFLNRRDLLKEKIKNPFRFSTAMNFSSRFPLFSPGAAIDSAKTKIKFDKSHVYHYVDGGYVENRGTSSMMEIFQLLDSRAKKEFKQVLPIVISLQFSADSLKFGKVIFANEISEILLGIYNTRGGRTMTSFEQLRKSVIEHNNGPLISQPILENQSSIPMNWALSSASVESLNNDIKKKFIDSTTTSGIAQIFNLRERYPFLKMNAKK